MAHVTLKRGDRLLLCSDGLHDYFPIEEEIAQKLSADAPGDALKDMVELAKTRGGHDNITGVAVQVTDVIEAVPAQLDGEHTQPVDVPASNPFASDEPTETALIEPPGTPPKLVAAGALTPAQLKNTQPMRIVTDEPDDGAAPAPGEPAPLEPPPAGASPDAETKSKAEPGEGGSADAQGAKPDVAPAAPPAPAAAAPDAPNGADGNAAAGPEPRPTVTEAKPDGDAAPAEIATADTGRIRIPTTDKDSL
jgi:hypothetical protein